MTAFFSRPAGLALGAAAALALAGVFYVRSQSVDKPNACPASAALVQKLAPLMRGAVAAAAAPKTPKPLPALDFLAPDGAPTSLAALPAKVKLVNIWATWCVPCREEMPTLDKLQAEMGSPDFEVVAINIDTSRLERARAFLAEIGVKNLAFYSDPKADAFYKLKMAGRATGLPTTYLVGKDGCELATLAGPANWASDDARALIRAALQTN